MKKDQFEMSILQKQNSQMVSKLHLYRRQNRELNNKNQELNVWVENLSQVFAGISSAWQSILNIEESLITLMKKKTDQKDKTVLSKYISHFKTFSDIVDNLAERIKNPGHSDQATMDVKAQLNAFVKSYEMLIKQFVDVYFKFNEEYTLWINQHQKKPDLQQSMKSIMTKQLDNRAKIKEFQGFMNRFDENFKAYKAYNQHALIDGIIAKKNQEIAALKDKNANLSRKLRIMMDYNPQSIDKLLQNIDDAQYYECSCGGTQIKYFKSVWEQAVKNISSKRILSKQSIQNNADDQGLDAGENVKKQQFQIIQNQNTRLLERNSLLLQKMEKSKLQNRLTQQMILKSNAYVLLKQQCQQLINYSNDLMGKLRKQKEYIIQIERVREDQLRQIKRKYQQNQTGSTAINQNDHQISKNKTIQNIKSQLTKSIQQIKQIYHQTQQKQTKTDQSLIKLKTTIQQARKQTQQLNNKIQHYNNEVNKNDKLEFRHQKFKDLENTLLKILEQSGCDEKILQLWKDFSTYVKTRDKKIKDLQNNIKAKTKQLTQKQTIHQMMKGQVEQTYKTYTQNKNKLTKFQQFTVKIQKQLLQLVEENFNLKTQSQLEKTLLNFRLKAQIQARNKFQEKLKLYQNIEEQIEEMKTRQLKIQETYNQYLNEQLEKVEKIKLEQSEKTMIIVNLKQQFEEKDKMLTKLSCEKQTLKSEISQLQMRFQSIAQKSEYEQIRRQMLYYKSRVICTCTGDRQREVVLKTCPHLFCRKCIDDTTNNRNRKCPVCGIKFTKSDIHQIKLN